MVTNHHSTFNAHEPNSVTERYILTCSKQIVTEWKTNDRPRQKHDKKKTNQQIKNQLKKTPIQWKQHTTSRRGRYAYDSSLVQCGFISAGMVVS